AGELIPPVNLAGQQSSQIVQGADGPPQQLLQPGPRACEQLQVHVDHQKNTGDRPRLAPDIYTMKIAQDPFQGPWAYISSNRQATRAAGRWTGHSARACRQVSALAGFHRSQQLDRGCAREPE